MIFGKEDIDSLRTRLLALLQQGMQYFGAATPKKVVDENTWPFEERLELQSTREWSESEALRAAIKTLSVDIAGAARRSPLLAEADMRELRHCTRQMLASVRFKEYRHSGVYVHHDEDVVLGVDPPSHEELPYDDPSKARERFNEGGAKVLDLIDLLSPSEAEGPVSDTSNYKPNTAFIMMAIDATNPELEDIRNATKEMFERFGIRAITADEIEHEGVITDRILNEIDTSEFLLADLSYERPNVYYEIGYAHSRGKRVTLYRKAGTKLHFDLAHWNCPEYSNTTELKALLGKRLEAMTNRPTPVGGR